jgi:L-lactate dehydrogenase
MKIGIVGAGFVGSTTAYALVMRGIGGEIVLVDKNEKRSQAETEDILHAVPFAHAMTVRAGNFPDLEGSRIVIIAAGVSQKPGESRLDLLERNSAVFREVIPQILTHTPEATLVVATNPVDVMTHLAARYAADFRVPSGRILGSGTILDTARFRSLLGEYLGVDAHHVHAYVVGEHGDSEVLAWSLARVGGMSLEDFCGLRNLPFDETKKKEIDDKVRQAAYRIIQGKGATYYGIGSALAHIIDVTLHDHRAILTVCTPMDDVADVSKITVSLPHLVGAQGILATFPLPLNDREQSALQKSARTIRQVIDELEGSSKGRK